MTVSTNTQAVLLLTAHFSKSREDLAKPLTTREWARFAFWLKDNGLTPERLVTCRPRELLEKWSDRQITLERLEALLNRGSALALAMEKWSRTGLWVMTRSDADYPERLKQRLGTISPAVLFGCGRRSLLRTSALAVVGSRNAVGGDLEYTRELGAAAANQGYTVVSGGARGVDESAMLGALDSEGTVIGVLAANLLRMCSSSKYRPHLVNNNLVLISPFHPEARFHAGNAMQRNKHVYCLSDAAVVIHSGLKGGTWSGAIENLKNRWVPLWLKPTADPAAGNGSLKNRGGNWLAKEAGEIDIGKLFGVHGGPSAPAAELVPIEKIDSKNQASRPMEGSRQLEVEPGLESAGNIRDAESPELAPVRSNESWVETGTPNPSPVGDAENPPLKTARTSDRGQAFYALFLDELAKACANSVAKPDELAASLGLRKTQVNLWLKRAVDEGKVRKRMSPYRYEWIDSEQGSLFES